MSAVIVKLEDLSIVSIYSGAANQSQYGGPWGDSALYAHLDVPEGLDPTLAKCENIDSVLTLSEDATLVANRLAGVRAAKLETLRQLRMPKLETVDIRVNMFALDPALTNQASWKAYRESLLAVTDPYKNYATDSGHATALDALDPYTYSWPSEPV